MALIGAVILLSFLVSVLLLRGSIQRSRRGHLPLPHGPKGWPVLGNLLQVGPNFHQTLYNLSKIHGPILHLRLGSVDFIIVNSKAAAETMLRIDLKFSSRPRTSATYHVSYKQQDMVFTHYGPRWRMLRKLCTIHLFSNKAMQDLRPIRADEVTRLVQNLSRNSSSLVDLSKEIHTAPQTLSRGSSSVVGSSTQETRPKS
ncbi:hypothetical protein HPP92_023368 [Vanilla planifolia]|uniref:Uncharacterized protein n=1 Tax=Vanilla planifolia TaxID=51239 RepID=A0A835UGN8_VANPL|nr:hypothetical protein HPP92_023368 [Vanilla planifolia]